MNVKADFYLDWIENLKDQMTQWGYSIPLSDDPQTIAIKHFHVLERKISCQPRTVLRSMELICPTEHQIALDAILDKARNGQDLFPHLSKQILNADYQDPLLNDWGIHHLHLGQVLDGNGFTERTGPLLFARVTDSHFYAIAILSHGAWTDRSLLQVLHDNWPDSISRFLLKDIRLTQEVTGLEHTKLRKAGVTVLTSLADGTVYMPIGGGITTAGTGINSVMEHDRYARLLTDLEKVTREQAAIIISTSKQQNITLPSELHFKVFVKNAEFLAQEQNTGLTIKVGRLP